MSPAGKAIVAAGHPAVCNAAAEILKSGGNAFDAAVAGGFAGAVAESALTSLGGGGFLLARTAAGRETLFDFFVDTPGLGLDTDQLEPHFFPVTIRFPGAAQDFNVGLGSVAVPGNLKGFLHVHEKLGDLPLAEILKPAVDLAGNGLVLNQSQAYFLNLLEPIMTLTPTGREMFCPNGSYVSQGKLMYNQDLAGFLERLPLDMGADFYKGAIAETIAKDMQAGQGLLTYEDLAAYQVIERQPLAIDYREYRLLTNPPPSVGGSLVGLALSLLGSQTISASSWGTPGHVLRTAAVMKEVELLRGRGISPEIHGAAAERIRVFSRGTTHISVADSQGNVASMTTSNGEGSGYIVPGTGIMLNNMMGEDDLHPEGFHVSPPGRRVASMMSPALLCLGEDVKLVIGSGGSKRIRTAITQVLSNVIDLGLPVQKAVRAPRIHWDGEILQVEPGFPEDAVKALAEQLPINRWSELDMYFGGVHTVVPGRAGGGDPRRGGTVVEV